MKKKQAALQKAGADQIAFKQINLRDKLMQLDKHQREAVANYFNLYNAAAWTFNEILDQKAKEYVDESVQYARELAEMENAQLDTAEDVEQFVQDVNHGS